MRLICIPVLLLILTEVVGQTDSMAGRYQNCDNYLIISEGNRMEFKTVYGYPMVADIIYGEGIFQLEGNRILLNATKPVNKDYTFYIVNEDIDPNLIYINVISDSMVLSDCTVVLTAGKKRKYIDGRFTDSNGEARFDRHQYPDLDYGMLKI